MCGAFKYNATHNPMAYRFDHVDYNPLYNGAWGAISQSLNSIPLSFTPSIFSLVCWVASTLFKLHMERRKRLEGCSHPWPTAKDDLGVGPP